VTALDNGEILDTRVRTSERSNSTTIGATCDMAHETCQSQSQCRNIPYWLGYDEPHSQPMPMTPGAYLRLLRNRDRTIQMPFVNESYVRRKRRCFNHNSGETQSQSPPETQPQITRTFVVGGVMNLDRSR